jgi:hypothetical protein
MSQLAQCLGFNLPNPLPGDVELLSYLFQGAVHTTPDPKPKAQHPSLPFGQGMQNIVGLRSQIDSNERIER